MTRARRLPVAVTVLALAVAAGACKRRAPTAAADAGPPALPTPALGAVTAQDLAASDDRPPHARLDTERIAAHARAVLAASGLFSAARADAGHDTAPTARVRIEFAVEETGAGPKATARTALRLRIDTRPAGAAAPRWNEEVQAAAETTYPRAPSGGGGTPAGAAATTQGRADVLHRLVTRVVDDLLSEYVARQKLWVGAVADVRRALGRDGGDIRLEAIRAVAERRLTSEVPGLLRLLLDDDETVRDAALGALVELRERRAVSEIAKSRSMRDRREMRKILDAMAALGGSEAVDYLAFVADAHDEPEIRQMAAAALQRLRRQDAAGGSNPP